VTDIHAQKILILDFGSQTTQLIARRVREARVYCEIHPCTMTLAEIKRFNPRGVILSGGPASVYAPDAPSMDKGILDLGVPILGICYGMQIITHLLGGRVARGERREYGPAQLQPKIPAGPLRELDVNEPQKVWMSHGDRIEQMPQGFKALAVTENSPVAAMGDLKKRIYGVQFHPEVAHTPQGAAWLAAFVLGECGCQPVWTMHNFAEATINGFKERLAGRKVICALSGGVDSAVTCCLAQRALGKDNVLGVLMPSPYSSEGSIRDSRQLVQNLGIACKEIPITPIYRAYLESLQEHLQVEKIGVALENIQARIRGNLLMALSNEFGYLVLSTGNKSEMAVGYCTLYGDMSGGLSVLADVPKTMVYQLARYLNRERTLIPEEIINKAPSAELRPGQKDQDTLPPYDVLDQIMNYYLTEGYCFREIAGLGFAPETVRWVIRAIDRSEYKRRQAAPGLKITSKAFGMGRRIPIAARHEF